MISFLFAWLWWLFWSSCTLVGFIVVLLYLGTKFLRLQLWVIRKLRAPDATPEPNA